MKVFGVSIIAIIVLFFLGYVTASKFPGVIPLPTALKAS